MLKCHNGTVGALCADAHKRQKPLYVVVAQEIRPISCGFRLEWHRGCSLKATPKAPFRRKPSGSIFRAQKTQVNKQNHMALYKYGSYLVASQHGAFDLIHNPGALAPYGGIYRCEGCGHEVGSHAGNPLPPQNHHQHNPHQGSIRWRLIVCAQTD